MTTKTRLIVAALAGAVLLTGAAVVQAQISPGGGPIAYSADTQAYEGNVLILSGRAELVQDGNRLRADTIRIFQADRPAGSAGFGGGDIQRMEAQSNVYFVTAATATAPEQVIRGDNAVYTVANDTIVVTGDVILQQGQSVTTGSRLTAQVKAGTARMDGAPGPGGSRVRGVFYPDNARPAAAPARR